MKKVSVIVAAHNEEKYLSRCLDSLLKQTLKEIEYILVDDASDDQTYKIMCEYNQRYPEYFKVFHNEQNEGAGISRNRGIEVAQGEYIGFVDGDDWIEPSTYEKLYKQAINLGADIVVCDVNKIFAEESRSINVESVPDKSGQIDIGEYIRNGESNAYSFNKLFKADLWRKFHYKKMCYEDLDVLLTLIGSATTLGYVKEPLCHYFKHGGTITSSYTNPRLFDIFKAYYDAIENSGKYRDEVVFNAAKRILRNMETPGFKYYLGYFIKLISLFKKEFICNPYIRKDNEVRRILAFTELPSKNDQVFIDDGNDLSKWKYFGKYTAFSTATSSKLMELNQIYAKGGVLILGKVDPQAPFGNLLTPGNRIIVGDSGYVLAFDDHHPLIADLKNKVQRENISTLKAVQELISKRNEKYGLDFYDVEIEELK